MQDHGESMVCVGMLQPSEDINPYKVEIRFNGKSTPKVFIKYPKIEYNQETHMYSDGSLCLYYPPDFDWSETTSVATTIIPWIIEWIIYYEIYKISGIWEGPAAPHLPRL